MLVRVGSRGSRLALTQAERFREWHASLDVVPEIASLRAWAEEVRSAELARARTRLGLSESQEAEVESVTARIVDKLLHLPTVRLKQSAAAADGGATVDVVRYLFGLEEPER